MVLKLTVNPIFQAGSNAVDLAKLGALLTLRRKRGDLKRELRDARKTATAVEAIAGLDHDTEIFGFTKGQFPLLNLIQAVFMVTGPAPSSLRRGRPPATRSRAWPRCERGRHHGPAAADRLQHGPPRAGDDRTDAGELGATTFALPRRTASSRSFKTPTGRSSCGPA